MQQEKQLIFKEVHPFIYFLTPQQGKKINDYQISKEPEMSPAKPSLAEEKTDTQREDKDTWSVNEAAKISLLSAPDFQFPLTTAALIFITMKNKIKNQSK